MALLALNNVEVVYDGVFLAVKGVSIEVAERGLVALLGANGAGKSTVLKSVSGLLRAERGAVSHGEIRLRDEDILTLDEPSLGLAPLLVDEIFDIIGRINADSGVSILLVEQNAAAALDIAHSAYLIENGRIVMSGAATELKKNPDIQEFYLGGGHAVDYHLVKHYRRRKRWLTGGPMPCGSMPRPSRSSC